MQNIRRLASLAALGAILCSCGIPTPKPLRDLGDLKPNRSKSAHIAALGGIVAIDAINEYGGLLEDESIVEYVNLLGKALARFCSDPHRQYTFVVLADPAPQAFAVPEGYIFITKGSLLLARNEAELASVLAREIAHLAHNHLMMKLDEISPECGEGDEQENLSEQANLAVELLFNNGLGKEFEYEADRLGTDIASAAGYNPWALKRLCNSLKPRKEKKGMAKTLPSADSRIRKLDLYLDENYGDFTTLPWNTDRYYEEVLSKFE